MVTKEKVNKRIVKKSSSKKKIKVLGVVKKISKKVKIKKPSYSKIKSTRKKKITKKKYK